MRGSSNSTLMRGLADWRHTEGHVEGSRVGKTGLLKLVAYIGYGSMLDVLAWLIPIAASLLGIAMLVQSSGSTGDAPASATIVAGGIAFDDAPGAQATPAAAADSTLYLAGDRVTAMADPDGLPLRMRFD